MFLHTLRILAIPFYEVHFPDFFIGDQVELRKMGNFQMTSHNQTLIDFVHLMFNLCSCLELF